LITVSTTINEYITTQYYQYSSSCSHYNHTPKIQYILKYEQTWCVIQATAYFTAAFFLLEIL